jgi:hypothetical protein
VICRIHRNFQDMKISRILVFTALIMVCTAQRCKRGGSDLLSRMYERAYKSELPLTPKKDPVFTPLLGSWLVGSERMMVVKKVDDTNLQFSFLSNTLTGDDVVYNGFTTTISQKKYLNMLSYRDNYLFFKVFYTESSGLKLSMITNAIRTKVADGTIYDYLTKNPNLLDTGRVWYPITLIKFSENERDRYISSKYKQQITGIESYLVYEKKFPSDTDLDSLKNKALDHSLDEARTIEALMTLAKNYPQTENKAKHIAKEKCLNTIWCIDYVTFFPNDPAKDSIITVAFTNAKFTGDFEKLLSTFPNDKRCAELEFKIAMSEVKRTSGYYSTSDRESFETRFASRPNVINYFNTLRLMNNIKLDKSNFNSLSYTLSPSGIAKIEQLAQLIQLINADKKNINDLYLVMNCDSTYASEKSDLINFKMGVNRCITITKAIQKKCPDIKIHTIPYLTNTFNRSSKKSSGFFLSDEGLSREKRDFYDDCYRVQQTAVIPNAQKEVMNTEYVREDELEEYVLNALTVQIPLYLKQKPYIKVIPANFWDGAYKNSQPGFVEIKEKLQMKAAEKGMDAKKLQNFVIQ